SKTPTDCGDALMNKPLLAGCFCLATCLAPSVLFRAPGAQPQPQQAEKTREQLLAHPNVKTTLDIVNKARQASGLEPVHLSATLSLGCHNHAKYLAINKDHPLTKGLKSHEEHEELKGYTPEGAKAAKRSVIARGSSTPPELTNAFLASFYHRMALLEPSLK